MDISLLGKIRNAIIPQFHRHLHIKTNQNIMENDLISKYIL